MSKHLSGKTRFSVENRIYTTENIPVFTPQTFDASFGKLLNKPSEMPDIFIIEDPRINFNNINYSVENDQTVPDILSNCVVDKTKAAISDFLLEKYIKRSTRQERDGDKNHNGHCHYYFPKGDNQNQYMYTQFQQFLSYSNKIKPQPYFITYWGTTDTNVLAFHKDIGKTCDSHKFTMVSCVSGVRRFFVIPERYCHIDKDDKNQIQAVTYNGLNLPLYSHGEPDEPTFKPFILKNYDKLPYIDLKAGQHILFKKTVFHATCDPTDVLQHTDYNVRSVPTCVNVCSFFVEFTDWTS